MITDEQVRRIALFFLFALMDEKTALQAAHKTVAQLKARGGPATAASTGPAIPNAEIVRVLRKQFEHFNKQLPRNRVGIVPDQAWVPATDLAGWVRFQKEASEQEVVAVALAQILEFDDEAIASGLNISLGTARYRIGRGVRQLGLSMKAMKA